MNIAVTIAGRNLKSWCGALTTLQVSSVRLAGKNI
jgi:hypothetical protein